jgi:cytochrome c oxidase assembly protein subunit 15
MEKELSISNRTNIILWLFSGCFLIFVMVVVGGITRLTGSGLSITKWDVVTGTIPPLSDAAWQKEFAHYAETPQF